MKPLSRKDILNNIVKKLSRYRNKVISITKIKNRIENIAAESYSDMLVYKIIYELKNQWHLASIRKQLFVPLSPRTQVEDILDDLYRDIVRQHAQDQCDKRYIWWTKALELCLLNYWPSEHIEIINDTLQRQEVLYQEKSVIFKQYSHKGQSLFSLFYKKTQRTRLWNYVLTHACLELALLESLYNTQQIYERYVFELVKKALRKHKKNLDWDIFADILTHKKHHTSINKLYKIAKSIDPSISNNFLTLIKKHSFFVTV